MQTVSEGDRERRERERGGGGDGEREVGGSVKPVLNWANVCSPDIRRTLRRTMIRFLIELLVRRI